jgi:hypothetical protein
VLGTDHSRLLQVAIVLLAARYENKIPLRWDLLKKVASLDFSEAQFKNALKHLAEHKFLEYQSCASDSNGLAHLASTPLATCTSEAEQSRAETEQSRAEKNTVELKLDVDPVAKVFDHWRQVHNHARAQLDSKRRTLIATQLKRFSEADLCESISGYLNSPHHMGQNEKATKYDDIELFLRDSKHVEAGLRFYAEPPRTDLSSKTRANVAAVADWVPPEKRNAG